VGRDEARRHRRPPRRHLATLHTQAHSVIHSPSSMHNV
jgi:hypothetical protein